MGRAAGKGGLLTHAILMLIGEYIHSFDDKNRVSLPAKFRSEIGKKIVITRGLDNCLFLYSAKAWQALSARLSGGGQELSFVAPASRGFARYLYGGASDVEVDGAGRVLIPEFLRSFAKIEGSAVFVGVHDHIEIWSDMTWAAYKTRLEGQGEALAEKLGEAGFI